MTSFPDDPPRFSVLASHPDRLEVTAADGRRFTFPVAELQATRRPPRLANRAGDLPVNGPLKLIELARRSAEEYAILNDLI